MPMDKDVQDLIESCVIRKTSEWGNRIEAECKECRHAIRAELASLQGANSSQQADRAVVSTKLDQLKTSVEELCGLIKGEGTRGSMDTRLALLEQSFHEIRSALQSYAETRGKTLREAFIQAAPSILTWTMMGVLLLIYLIFTHFGVKPPIMPGG